MTDPHAVRNRPLAVHLRPTRPEDLPFLYEIGLDPASNNMAGTKPRTREVFMATWAQHFANPAINGQVIEIEDVCERAEAGHAGVSRGAGSAAGVAGVKGVGGKVARTVVGSIACFQVEGTGGGAIDCVGYWIARPHWGKGIASRALAQFLVLEKRRPLHATAATSNAASRHILEKCGFRLAGIRMGEETERFQAREIADYVLR